MSNKRYFRPGDSLSKEDLETINQVDHVDHVVLDDPSKIFRTDEGTLLVEDLKGNFTVWRPCSASELADHGLEDPDLCWHGSSEENFTSEYQQMIDEYLTDIYKVMYSGKLTDEELHAMEQQAFNNVCHRHKEIAVLKQSELCQHIFAYCAREFQKGQNESVANATHACAFGLFIRYIMMAQSAVVQEYMHRKLLNTEAAMAAAVDDAVKKGNERFNVYIQKMNNHRRGLIRILAKHLPCDCFKKMRAATSIGDIVARCDWCHEYKDRKVVRDCVLCRMDSYCSKECQRKDWKKQHKRECPNLR